MNYCLQYPDDLPGRRLPIINKELDIMLSSQTGYDLSGSPSHSPRDPALRPARPSSVQSTAIPSPTYCAWCTDDMANAALLMLYCATPAFGYLAVSRPSDLSAGSKQQKQRGCRPRGPRTLVVIWENMASAVRFRLVSNEPMIPALLMSTSIVVVEGEVDLIRDGRLAMEGSEVVSHERMWRVAGAAVWMERSTERSVLLLRLRTRAKMVLVLAWAISCTIASPIPFRAPVMMKTGMLELKYGLWKGDGGGYGLGLRSEFCCTV